MANNVSSNNFTSLYSTIQSNVNVTQANVPVVDSSVASKNLTTLYSGNAQPILPQYPYGNANVERFLNSGTDGGNTVENIIANGTITVKNLQNNFTGNVVFYDEITGNFSYGVPGNIISNNANFANFAGNVTIASQPNITSLGTLTGLNINGLLTMSSNTGFDIQGSNDNPNANSRNLSITGGNVSNILPSGTVAGSMSLAGGTAESLDSGNVWNATSGIFSFLAGTANTANGNAFGGTATIRGGQSFTNSGTARGGPVNITSGFAQSNNGNAIGGNLTITTNLATANNGNATSGNILIITGGAVSTNTAFAGNVSIQVGTTNGVAGNNKGAIFIGTTANIGAINMGFLNVPFFINSPITIGADIRPNANITYDLGNTTNRWKDLYLSGNSIYLGNITLQSDSNNALVVPNLSVNGNSTLGNLATANYFQGNFLGNISGIANGNSSISIPIVDGNIIINSGGGITPELTITNSGVNVEGTLSVSGNSNIANLGVNGLITATGNCDVANINVTGNIIPTANITYDLGNTNNRFNDLYLAGNTIYLGNITLECDTNDRLLVANLSVTGNSVVGNLIGNVANGTSNISIPTINGNINTSVNGTANVLVVSNVGATLNGNFTANAFQLNTTSGITTASTGQMFWDATEQTMTLGMNNGVQQQVGLENYILVKASSAINDGQVVMWTGAQGDNVQGAPANVSVSGFRPGYVLGVATQNIANNGTGYVTTFGQVHGLNTNAYNVGDLLWLDVTTPGGLTNVQPSAPNYQIQIATVTKKSAGDGHIQIIVRPEPKLDDLSDVSLTSPTTGQALVYNASNIWVNGNVNVANFAGNVTNSAQPNITSVGTLTSLSVSGTITPSNVAFTKFNETVVNGGNTGAATLTPDAAAGTIYQYTLTGNITLSTLSNAVAGTSMTIILTQDGTGNRLLTSTMKFAGGSKTLSTAANSIDVMGVFYDGTTYYASLTKGYA